MNIVLFHKNEISKPLSRRDHRAKHIIKVLRLEVGQSFKMGIVGGDIGDATLTSIDEKELCFEVEIKDKTREPYPLTLIAGFVRPNSVKRILRDASSLELRGSSGPQLILQKNPIEILIFGTISTRSHFT